MFGVLAHLHSCVKKIFIGFGFKWRQPFKFTKYTEIDLERNNVLANTGLTCGEIKGKREQCETIGELEQGQQGENPKEILTNNHLQRCTGIGGELGGEDAGAL